MKMLCMLASCMFLVGLSSVLVAPGFVPALALSICLFIMMGVGHNFMHQRDVIWRYAFDVTAFGHREWRVSHVLSHHLFPVATYSCHV